MSSTTVKNQNTVKKAWKNFSEKNPTVAQFIVFFLLSNGVTVLQMVAMPLLKGAFEMTNLVDVNFQVGQIGKTLTVAFTTFSTTEQDL